MFNDEITTSYLETIKKQSKLDWLKQKYSNHPITQKDIIELLQISLIDQWLAQFNYFRSYNLSQTEGKADFDPQFKQHEEDQYQHRHEIAQRIRQLGARISVESIQTLITCNSDGANWKEQNTNNSSKLLLNRLQEQKKAVQFYSLFLNIIEKMQNKDTTTQTLIKQIKADEQQHVKDLTDLGIERGFIK